MAHASKTEPRQQLGSDDEGARANAGRARAFGVWLLKAAGVFASFAVLFTRPARLFDANSYFHLALARWIAGHGFVDALPWARVSSLGSAYGDKELLFHLALVPFAVVRDAERAGQLAQALLCTALALSLCRLGSHALGRPGAIVAVLVFCGSGSFVLRALRLRPELLALLLLLWVVWALARQRYLLAAILAFAFTLAHTAFHSLLGLSLAWFAWQRWSQRRWEWRLPLCVAIGVAGALLVHPQFPDNLAVFWVQNIEFFRYRARLDVGGEFQPLTTLNLLQLDGLWLLGLLTLVLAREPRAPTLGVDPSARRMASFCWIAALAFGGLFLQMGRFATLAVPFATLAVVFELSARGQRIGRRLLPAGRRWSSRVVLGTLGILALSNALGTAYVNWQLGGCFDTELSRELNALSKQLPAGARVAAAWDDAEQYAFFAPQARYLNVLDPVFMAVAQPGPHAAWMRILAGNEADTPRTLARALDSEYLAYAAAGREALSERLSNDPRAELLHRGQHLLYRFHPDRNSAFVRGWTAPSIGASASGEYVDASDTLAADGCGVLSHREQLTTASARLIELAAWGPSVLFVDGEQRVQLPAPGFARLGQGVAIPVRLEPGPHQFVVRTCEHAGRAGFYLVHRGPL